MKKYTFCFVSNVIDNINFGALISHKPYNSNYKGKMELTHYINDGTNGKILNEKTKRLSIGETCFCSSNNLNKKNLVNTIEITYPDNKSDDFIGQEHTVLARDFNTDYPRGAFIYEQFPFFKNSISTFSLISPKTIISSFHSSKLILAKPYSKNSDIKTSKLKIFLSTLNNETKLIMEKELVSGSCLVLEPKNFIENNIGLENQIYYISAFGSYNPIICYSLITNNKNNSVVMEHSLAPWYYLSLNLNLARENSGYI